MSIFEIKASTFECTAILPMHASRMNFVRNFSRSFYQLLVCNAPGAMLEWAACKLEQELSQVSILLYVKAHIAAFYLRLSLAEYKQAYCDLATAASFAQQILLPSDQIMNALREALKHCNQEHTDFRQDIIDSLNRYSLKLAIQKQKEMTNSLSNAEDDRQAKYYSSISDKGSFSACFAYGVCLDKVDRRLPGSATTYKISTEKILQWICDSLVAASRYSNVQYCVLTSIAQYWAALQFDDLPCASHRLNEAAMIISVTDIPYFEIERTFDHAVDDYLKRGLDENKIASHYKDYKLLLSKHSCKPLPSTLLNYLVGADELKLHPEIQSWFDEQRRRTYDSLPHLQSMAHQLTDRFMRGFDYYERVAQENEFLSENELEMPFNFAGKTVNIRFSIQDIPDDATGSLVSARIGYRVDSPLGHNAPLFVDCNNYNPDTFSPDAGELAWIAMGGIWLSPLHESLSGHSADGDNIISCVKHMREAGFAGAYDPSAVILFGSGINARLATLIAISAPELFTDLIVENGIYDKEPHEALVENFYTISSESPLNPRELPHNILFLNEHTSIPHLADLLHDAPNNIFVAQSSQSNKRLNNPIAFTFALSRGGNLEKIACLDKSPKTRS